MSEAPRLKERLKGLVGEAKLRLREAGNLSLRNELRLALKEAERDVEKHANRSEAVVDMLGGVEIKKRRRVLSPWAGALTWAYSRDDSERKRLNMLETKVHRLEDLAQMEEIEWTKSEKLEVVEFVNEVLADTYLTLVQRLFLKFLKEKDYSAELLPFSIKQALGTIEHKAGGKSIGVPVGPFIPDQNAGQLTKWVQNTYPTIDEENVLRALVSLQFPFAIAKARDEHDAPPDMKTLMRFYDITRDDIVDNDGKKYRTHHFEPKKGR